MSDSQLWIDKLGLIKHPEGGYYKEIYKCPDIITTQDSASPFAEKRHLATSIYFLLAAPEVSRFHRLKSDEIWYFHAGSSLVIYLIDDSGKLQEFALGLNVAQGEVPQIIVPRDSIFGAIVSQTNSFSLIGCMVSPGFDFNDFELFSRETLLQEYPQHEAIINRLT